MTRRELEVAKATARLRKSLGKKAEEFGALLGVSVRTVHRWETEKAPRGKMLLRLADTAESAELMDIAAVFRTHLNQQNKNAQRQPTAHAIRILRAALNETQNQFAQRLGVSVVSVARFETTVVPGLATLDKLAAEAVQLGRKDLQAIFEQRPDSPSIRDLYDLAGAKGFLLSLVDHPGVRDLASVKLAVLCLLLGPSLTDLPKQKLDEYKAVLDEYIREIASPPSRHRSPSSLFALMEYYSQHEHDAIDVFLDAIDVNLLDMKLPAIERHLRREIVTEFGLDNKTATRYTKGRLLRQNFMEEIPAFWPSDIRLGFLEKLQQRKVTSGN